MSNISKKEIAKTLKRCDEYLLTRIQVSVQKLPAHFSVAPSLFVHACQQVRELDVLVNELQELLSEISGMGLSPSASINMPSADWYYKLFATCQRFARDGEQKIKQARGG